MLLSLLVLVALVAAAIGSWWVVHRRSSLVKRWRPSSFQRHTAGPLSILDSGVTGRDGEPVVLVLHGLGATSDYFGAFYDVLGRHHRVVIADLLGFGRSLDEDRHRFGLDDHVAAIDDTLRALGLADAHVVLAAHSMSGAVALTWADRNRDRTDGVYLWGPPVYVNESAAESVVSEYGVMGRLFALDTKWAEQACRLSCMHRSVSGRVMAVMAPSWPTEVSRQASRHTWEAYRQSLRSLVLEFNWSSVLPASVPVTIFRGTDDPIGDRDHMKKLAGAARIVDVPGADHHVALQHPELLIDALDRRRTR